MVGLIHEPDLGPSSLLGYITRPGERRGLWVNGIPFLNPKQIECASKNYFNILNSKIFLTKKKKF